MPADRIDVITPVAETVPIETMKAIMPPSPAVQSVSISFDDENAPPPKGTTKKMLVDDWKAHNIEDTDSSSATKTDVWKGCGALHHRQILLRKMGAELLATFVLVFAGCGAIMVDELKSGAVTLIGIATVFGIAAMVMIYTVGHISGAHMNPAVTFALAVVGRFPWNQVAAYIGTQIFAAICASFALHQLIPEVKSVAATFPPNHNDQKAFTMEAIITFIVMFVASAVSTDSLAIRQMGGVAIGAAIGMNVIFAAPISGASMNPARSIGPAVVTGNYHSLWVYIAGPTLGALLGVFFYAAIRLPEPAVPTPKNKTLAEYH